MRASLLLHSARLLLALSLGLGLSPALQAAGAAADVVPQRVKAPFPLLLLADRQAGGQRAIDLLGGRLDEVAAWYGKSPDEFRAKLLNDRRMRIDQPRGPAILANSSAFDAVILLRRLQRRLTTVGAQSLQGIGKAVC